MRLVRTVCIFIMVLAAVQLKAQDFPFHYFTIINPMVNNPSFAANERKIKADMAAYNLWAGGYKPISDYMLSFSIEPDLRKRERKSRNLPWVGLGASVLKERIGPFNQFIFNAIYSYHIPFSRTSRLSFGISGIVENLNIDVNSLTPNYSGDPRLVNGNNSSIVIDGGFGTTYRNKDFQISFSAINLAPATFRFDDSPAKDISRNRKLFLTGSYDFKLSEKIGFKPEVTIRNSIQNEINYDISIKSVLSFFALGLGYRSENSIFIFSQVFYHDFVFTYFSENPLQSKHMIGSGHTFAVGWSMKGLR